MNRQGFERFMHMNWPNCSQSDYDRCYELWRLVINAAAQDGPATARSGEACGNASVKPSCAAAPESTQPPPGSAAFRHCRECFTHEDCADKEQCAAAPPGSAGWLPTAANINALPEPVRRYIHDIETRCDPAGDVAAMTLLRDQVRALSESNRILRDAAAPPGSVPPAPVARYCEELSRLRGWEPRVDLSEPMEGYMVRNVRPLYTHSLEAPADSNSDLVNQTALRGEKR